MEWFSFAGWMQLVILIYHMTGASQVLPIYMHIQILFSSYLFLTGYGHFSFYWSGREMGIVRYFQVISVDGVFVSTASAPGDMCPRGLWVQLPRTPSTKLLHCTPD